MKKLAIFLAIIGAIIGFAWSSWYLSGPYPESTLEADRLLDPAVVMQRCIDEVNLRQAAKRFAGLYTFGRNAEKECAEMHNLYLRDGKWHRKQDP